MQAELLFKLGAYVAPIEDLASRPDDFSASDRRRIMARTEGDRHSFGNTASEFMQERPGRPYSTLRNKFLNALKRLVLGAARDDIPPEEIRVLLNDCVPLMQEAILDVPLEDASGVLEADSPFTAYCRIKDLCSTVAGMLVWTDRYFDASVFHRYLRDVRPAASVTLVTLDPARLTSTKDRQRYNDFLDVSRLFAVERGQARYRLVVHPDFHDRWLRCDGQLYALGGSVKDAGQKSDFAIGRIDPTPPNLQTVDDLVSAGTELFGPNIPMHP